VERIPLVARVALPVALQRPLTYKVPDDLADRLVPGHRVQVPLRGRTSYGFVLEVGAPSDFPGLPGNVKLRAVSAIDPEPVLLDAARLRLVRWMSRYYCAPIGMALEAAVPKGIARPPRRPAPNPDIPPEAEPPITPTAAQAEAVARITEAIGRRSGTRFLLHGVTGSGKTEVYLRAARTALDAGQGVLFLVPEIALGTQIVRWVRRRLGGQVVEYHSQMKPAARRQAWWRAHAGEARVVVGARSAVFVPVARLGLVVIDEEHEPSYKQGETPRYHGRDTALMRARIEEAVVVLGSATPSLESSANADRGKYERLELPVRVDGRPQPEVTLVDLRRDAAEEPRPQGPLRIVEAGERDLQDPLSPYLRERLQQTIREENQAILFLNRRGFSTSVQCRACGHVFECPRCSVTLTHHRTEGILRCHYCNHHLRKVTECPQCGSADFAFSGTGTQRVEASLAHHLPEARILRMDLDTTRRRGALADMIDVFERGEADVLLGTQMVAKGFDFPRVTLVGVIHADREMSLPDFRGQERAFQLLTQVAGRAGRGEKPGEVVFQTYLPDHHVISAAGQQDYRLFYGQETEERRPLGYPPFRRMANLLFDGPDEAAVIRRAGDEADRLAGRRDLTLLGPAPMPLSRLKGQYRWHLTLIADGHRDLAEALAEVSSRLGLGRVRVQVDVDPVSML